LEILDTQTIPKKECTSKSPHQTISGHCTMESKDDKLSRLKAQQRRWLDERQANIDRKDAEQTVSHHGDKPSPAPEAVLEQLTKDITYRLRDEIQSEPKPDVGGSSISSQLDRYMSNELSTHSCSICYELMLPPKRAPVLLFPCGHTFCKECIEMHQKAKNATCPTCRAVIESKAANISLQQLIERYASMRGSDTDSNFSKRIGRVNRQREGETDAEQAQRHLQTMKSLQMRCKVLNDQLVSSRRTVGEVEKKERANTIAMKMLLEEEEETVERLRLLQEELKLVREHLAKQQQKADALQLERERAHEQAGLIEGTIGNLESELDKSRLLVEGLAPSLLR
jgi:hypothetical protein